MVLARQLPPVVGGYLVEEPVGEGESSFVYRVRQADSGAVRALKLLRGDNPERERRLRLEGELQRGLRHPNVVVLHEAIELDGVPGLVLDFVAGGSVEELLCERRLSLEEIDALALGIMDGVEAVHAAGVVHRDLKPSNVLLTSSGIPKIADFGLAKRLSQDEEEAGSSRRTRAHVLMGTPSYMAPEQIEDAGRADAQSDLFSLGVLLYELATSVPAYEGDKVVDVLYAVSHGLQTPAQLLRPELPPRMLEAIEVAMCIDRRMRVQSVEELREIWLGDRVARSATPTLPVWMAEERVTDPSADGSLTIVPDESFVLYGTPTPEAASIPPARRSPLERWMLAALMLALMGLMSQGVGVRPSGVAALPEHVDPAICVP